MTPDPPRSPPLSGTREGIISTLGASPLPGQHHALHTQHVCPPPPLRNDALREAAVSVVGGIWSAFTRVAPNMARPAAAAASTGAAGSPSPSWARLLPSPATPTPSALVVSEPTPFLELAYGYLPFCWAATLVGGGEGGRGGGSCLPPSRSGNTLCLWDAANEDDLPTHPVLPIPRPPSPLRHTTCPPCSTKPAPSCA